MFRIASMTKSFTAAAVLALRDDGALQLDDPAADFVPELRGLPPVTADAPAITIRHLLTMTAGFPTDDPWGDRQQGLPLAEFDALLRRASRRVAARDLLRVLQPGLRAARPGHRRGHAASYAEFVTARLLGPLGLDRTGFEAAAVDPAGLARGYQRRPDGWAELVPDGYGAFAPMGGVFSCVHRTWPAGPAGWRRRSRPVPRPPVARTRCAGPPPGDAAAAGHDRSPGRAAAARGPGHGRPARLRLRPVHRGEPGLGPDSPAQRRVPGFRQPHALASGDRPGRDRAGQQHLRARPPAGRAADGGRAAGHPGGGGPGRRRRAATRTGRPVAETIRAQRVVDQLTPVLGRPGGRADLHRERRPGRALRAAPGQGRAAVAAPRASAAARARTHPNTTHPRIAAGGCMAHTATPQPRYG